jgi:outer membrane lipoprotein SlyB
MMNSPKTLNVLAFSCLLLLVACSQKRPVLYPNYHLQQVGDETAQTEIDDCIHSAKEYGTSSSSSGKTAKSTARGGAVGAAGGAATGAVFGSVGRGAAAGAAGGAAVGCLQGLFRSPEPDPVFKRFVEKCLREKGYEPIGWK